MSKLALMKEVEDLKQKIASHNEEYGKKLDKACKEYLDTASDDFQTFFKRQGFQVESSPSREKDYAKGLNITSTYNDLSFSLDLPHYETRFFGFFSVCLLTGKGIPNYKVALVRKECSPGISTKSWTVPDDEDERLKQEISRLKNELEEAETKASTATLELEWIIYDSKEQLRRERGANRYTSLANFLKEILA